MNNILIMLTNQDIQKIIEANKEVFATKDDIKSFTTKEDLKNFATKDDIIGIKEDLNNKFNKAFKIFATKEDLKEAVNGLPSKEDFNNLQTSIDSYAKKSDAYFQEMLLLANKVDRQEKWIHQLAEKLGVQLKY